MKLFNKHSKDNSSKNDKVTTKDVIETMLGIALAFYNEENYEDAYRQYKNILELEPNNAEALFNFGILYATGRGVKRDLCQATYLFRMAEINGDEEAGKFVLKSKLDYFNECVQICSYEELYKKIEIFMMYVFPEKADKQNIGDDLYSFGLDYCINYKKSYASALKVFKAGAIMCNNADCKNYLGICYNCGWGIEQNDLASLYWFDAAADSGLELAKKDRDGLLNAYRNLGQAQFSGQMELLADWCRNGTDDIPKTPEKVLYWLKFAGR